MPNEATQHFEAAIEELQVHLSTIEQALENPNSGVCISGSRLLDVHHVLMELSERAVRCARNIPLVESADEQARLIAQWEQGATEPQDAIWVRDTILSPGD